MKSQLKTQVTQFDHLKGLSDAQIVIVEYADFQCPNCGAAFSVLEQITKEYGKDICVVYRHFPIIESHPFAVLAAEASEAADNQNKFWEMHDSLFLNQSDLSENSILLIAKEIGLDMEKFVEDSRDKDMKEKVQIDVKSGIRSNVTGTPTLFINGKIYNREITFENLAIVIDGILQNRKEIYQDF